MSGMPIRKGNKFHAKKVSIDGITFDSMKEGQRYRILSDMLLKGIITRLEVHPVFEMYVTSQNQKICSVGRYKADFLYYDTEGKKVVEDVKGYKKGAAYQIFRLKKKIVEALYDIKILET